MNKISYPMPVNYGRDVAYLYLPEVLSPLDATRIGRMVKTLVHVQQRDKYGRFMSMSKELREG